MRNTSLPPTVKVVRKHVHVGGGTGQESIVHGHTTQEGFLCSSVQRTCAEVRTPEDGRPAWNNPPVFAHAADAVGKFASAHYFFPSCALEERARATAPVLATMQPPPTSSILSYKRDWSSSGDVYPPRALRTADEVASMDVDLLDIDPLSGAPAPKRRRTFVANVGKARPAKNPSGPSVAPVVQSASPWTAPFVQGKAGAQRENP